MANSESAPRMAAAAEALLALLPAGGPAHQELADETARRDWHYVPRAGAGLAFRSMDAAQQKATYDLVATGLGVGALAAVTTIIGLEDVLDELEGKRRHRHRADYSVTIFGRPTERVWGWRFEGHHVSLNVTVAGGALAATPLFLGANPAEVLTASGFAVTRPLAAEEDLAREVLAALAPAHRAEAQLADDAPEDILTTNAPRFGRGGEAPRRPPRRPRWDGTGRRRAPRPALPRPSPARRGGGAVGAWSSRSSATSGSPSPVT